MIKSSITLIFAFAFSFLLNAQEAQWKPTQKNLASASTIKPSEFEVYEIDFEGLKTFLNLAPHRENVLAKNSSYIFSIPTPAGETWDFKIVESPVMAPGLQAQYPDIRTFIGQGTGEYAHATARFDFTLRGFHAQVLVAGETFYIDPYNDESLNLYIVYSREAFYASSQKVMANCNPEAAEGVVEMELPNQKLLENPNFVNLSEIDIPEVATTNGTNLRTYRLALACTGEYASFHGGTVPLVMSAFTTSMNRVNGIFVRDVSLEMIMVDDNDDLIYLNSSTDPYSNGSGGAMLSQNQTTCDDVIGSANYDIGHVFSTGGGGVAYLQSVCGSLKAGGVTGQSSPVGDPFDVDYVAHEMGHQWGGNHTQNNSCNRSTNAAYEPGSASTIMGYAGICSPNLQSNSDDHFNNHSYNEMYNFSVTGSGNNCAVTTSSGNTPPTLTVRPSGFFIPIETPFELTATGNDVNDDALTYCWEQRNLGPATASSDFDLTDPSGNAPIFRSWSPTTNATRVFPRLPNLVNNTTVIGELLPTYSRDLTFRCTVRDNFAGGGGVTDDQVDFEATASAGPFLVTLPNTSVSWIGNSGQTVVWDVANTNSAPVNCAEVDIFLSIDGGYTYPFQLADNVANDGSENVVVPNIPTSQARIKVKAADNIFFDISNQNFSIQPGVVNDIDAAISSINEPSGDICGSSIIPEITIMNFGIENLTAVDIVYDLNGENTMFFSWTGNLASNEMATVTLSEIELTNGIQTFNVILINPNGQPDENGSNNAASATFNVDILTGEALPYSNDFEGTFPGTGWEINNPDNDITWESENVINDIDCTSSNTASINFYAYNDDGETDDLVSPRIDLNGTIEPEITFDYSYKRYSATFNDRMQVQIKSGCEDNWTTLWDKENLELATAGSQTSNYTPNCGDWESQSIDLSAYQGEIVQIRFRAITGYGNNLYLDNISVFDEAPACGPGFFVDGPGCVECPPGTYCPGDGNSYPCATGTYQSASGATFCLSCEAGSFSDIIGATECELCPAGTYQGQEGAIECFDCAAGTVSDEGATFCDECGPGFFEEAGICLECPPGTYCPGDGNSYPCAAGTYQSASGATFCLSCEAGSFSDIIGATECELCPAGTYQGQEGAIECFDCAAGTVSDEGATFCDECGPGFFEEAGICLECPPGTYCPGDGNSYPCAAGTYQSASGATFCISCEAGSFSDIIGATECELCPAGTYQGQEGAIECFDCAAGTVSDEGATFCDECGPGFFEEAGICLECPPGTYCPGDGNSYLCAAGSFQDLPGQTECISCGPGSFSDTVGAIECELCPAGTYQGDAGATACFECIEGTSSGIGATICEEVDCLGEIGGDAYADECGICDDNPANDNQTCLDCAGVPNGSAYADECGVCDDNPANDNETCIDCSGVPNGSAYTDECGVCDDNPANDNQTCLDCAGVPNGSAYTDECGVCDDNPANDNETCIDCSGVPNGSAYTDECGVCDDNPANDNQTCADCAGVPNGSASLDDCGTCAGGTTGVDPCVIGCMSPTSCNYNSEATVDDGSCIEPIENCSICNETNDGLILIDGDEDGICDADETILTATFDDGAPNCNSLDVIIWVYEPNTSNLLSTLTTILEDGTFSTELNLPEGNYDIYIKVNSYLSKGFYNTAVGVGNNNVILQDMVSGDVNGNDGINITDFSILNGAFNSLAGDANYNPNADLNCDGGVNIVDVSILNQGFNQVGDHAALLNP